MTTMYRRHDSHKRPLHSIRLHQAGLCWTTAVWPKRSHYGQCSEFHQKWLSGLLHWAYVLRLVVTEAAHQACTKQMESGMSSDTGTWSTCKKKKKPTCASSRWLQNIEKKKKVFYYKAQNSMDKIIRASQLNQAGTALHVWNASGGVCGCM